MLKLREIKSLNQTSTSTPPLLYDPFLFVDSLTNRSIPVKNIRDRTILSRSHRQSQTHNLGANSQIKKIDECIDFLKQTMSFRKKALRERLFVVHNQKKQQNHTQESELVRKKRLIRQLIAEEIEQKNRNQFEKYLNIPNYKLDQKLLEMSKGTNFLISKSNITKIVNTLEKKQKHPHSIKKRYDESDDPFFDKMDTIELEMKNQIREKLRKSGEYLVDPQYHFVQAKSFAPLKFKQPFQNKFQERRAALNKLQWEQNAVNKQNAKSKVKPSLTKFTNKHEATLINLVVTGDVVDIEIFLQKHKKDNLRVKDERGNTLAHIAVHHNKTMIFECLLRHLGVSMLLIKNSNGETAADLAVRLDRREILSYIPQSML